VIGPALGGFLADRLGFRPMLAIAAGLYVTAAILRVWMATAVRFAAGDRSERPTVRSLRTSLGTMAAMLVAGGLVTWILVTDGVQDVAYTLSGNLIPLYLLRLGGLDAQRIGWLVSLRGTGMIVATLASGWLSDRYGERRIIALGFVLQFVALAIFVQTRAVSGFALSAAIVGLGFGTLIPAYDSLVSKAIPEKMRGIAFGVFGTSIGLISLPAPWLGAQLWERLSPQAPFAVTALAAAVCVVLVWRKFVHEL
jgi:MFS family permease